MKKVIVGLICLLLISSCGLEIPQSITIKGSPSLYVPLGNPLAGKEFEGKTLVDLISADNIKEMIETSNTDEEIKIFEVSTATINSLQTTVQSAMDGIDPNVLTYMVEYPLDSIPLDLQKYIDKAMDKKSEGITIPQIEGYSEGDIVDGPYYIYENGDSWGKYEKQDYPFIRIPLYDMAKYVKEVTRINGQSFGLKILDNEKNTLLQKYLRLRIPALGIRYDDAPILDIENNLWFINTAQNETVFKPREDLIDNNNEPNGELWIYARITGVCEGTVTPEVVYDWEKAVIDTQDETISKQYAIGNNSLGGIYGGALSFKKVLGYVYMSGMESSSGDAISMTVKYSGNEITRNLKFINELKYDTESGTVTGNLIPSSFSDSNDPLDMTDFFNDSNEEFTVDICISELLITNNKNGGFKPTIDCKLCVLIPLDLKVSAVDGGIPLPSTYSKDYVPLGEEFRFGDGTEDLFGRNGEDNIIKSVGSVDIYLTDIDITIMDDPAKLAVLIENQSAYELLKFGKSNASVTLNKNFINPLFNPGFTILVKKDNNQNFGSFKIKRVDETKFDFNLSVKANKAELEYTLGSK